MQVTRDGVVHMAFHPRSDAIILAAGDKGGRVGLWQLDHESFEVWTLRKRILGRGIDKGFEKGLVVACGSCWGVLAWRQHWALHQMIELAQT